MKIKIFDFLDGLCGNAHDFTEVLFDVWNLGTTAQNEDLIDFTVGFSAGIELEHLLQGTDPLLHKLHGFRRFDDLGSIRHTDGFHAPFYVPGEPKDSFINDVHSDAGITDVHISKGSAFNFSQLS